MSAVDLSRTPDVEQFEAAGLLIIDALQDHHYGGAKGRDDDTRLPT